MQVKEDKSRQAICPKLIQQGTGKTVSTTPKGFWKQAHVSETHRKTRRITNLADIKYIRWPLISKVPPLVMMGDFRQVA